LEYYIGVVRQSCEALDEINEPVLAPIMRNKIFLRRREEVAAYATFMAARRRLWRFLIHGLIKRELEDIDPLLG
jgi:hypothetical protein